MRFRFVSVLLGLLSLLGVVLLGPAASAVTEEPSPGELSAVSTVDIDHTYVTTATPLCRIYFVRAGSATVHHYDIQTDFKWQEGSLATGGDPSHPYPYSVHRLLYYNTLIHLDGDSEAHAVGVGIEWRAYINGVRSKPDSLYLSPRALVGRVDSGPYAGNPLNSNRFSGWNTGPNAHDESALTTGWFYSPDEAGTIMKQIDGWNRTIIYNGSAIFYDGANRVPSEPNGDYYNEHYGQCVNTMHDPGPSGDW